MQDSVLDDLDQRLVHAVQISPRATWTALAPIVGADPVTLARRWARMREQGVVYVTGYGDGPPGLVVLIEIDCSPGETLAVAETLSRDPEPFTIDLTAGGRDILLTLAATDAAALAEWTLERIRGISGIRSMRTHLVSATVRDARDWRLRSLSPGEVAQIEAMEPPAPAVPVRLSVEQRRRLGAELSEDGRIGTTELARRVGVSPRRVRDAIAEMRASGRLAIRVDVARDQTPWPIYAWYFLKVPAAMVARIGTQLGRMEEVRLVVNTVGEYNVIMAVWLRTLQDVSRLEATIEERLPGVTIADRSVVLRTMKHLGHLLDRHGRVTGETIPIR
ncbi:Lrp/AsnC family transcriptional regulator [Microbacterium sp. ZW T5_45]|uniref:Lrp/AsnC family transcriptional regulator n=1 Tax=Microbacterium sp. ZW T5_45 TaxID=3378080 RepID=UPI0038531497